MTTSGTMSANKWQGVNANNREWYNKQKQLRASETE